MTEIVWRDAGPEDASILVAIGRQSFTETFGHLYTRENLAAFLENHSEENWRGELADPRYAVRLGFVDGVNAAYVKLGPPSLPFTPGAASIELRQFYVLKPWQGAGLAPQMMDWVIAEARRRGAGELYLSVFTDNVRAQRFYDRYGFEPVGRYDFMVGTHADEDVIMRLKL
jgi:ribosomal protein S18 acetylase RimI-like enzyme